MVASLCMTGIMGFLGFLKSAVFVVRIYTREFIISGTTYSRRRKKLSGTNGKWK